MSASVDEQRDTRADQETFLYRHYDDQGGLLYIGISIDPVKRTAFHRYTAPWRRLIFRVETESHPNRAAAMAAEEAAIKAENPQYNISKGAPSKRISKGRKPIYDRPMTKLEADARHRRTAAQKLASAYEALVGATKVNNPAQKTRWMQMHAEVITRAYAAQKRGE